MKSLCELADEYIEHLRSLNMSERTLKVRRSHLRIFLQWLAESRGVFQPSDMGPGHIEAWHRHACAGRTSVGRPHKPESINNRLLAVRQFLRRLAEQGSVHPRLADIIECVKAPKTLGGTVLDHSQVRKMLSRMPLDSPVAYTRRTMLEVLYTSGVRRSELLGMDLGHIDFRHRTILVTGKGGKQRLVPIGRTATRHLETYIKAIRPFLCVSSSTPALFLNARGDRVNEQTLARIVREAADRAGLDMKVTPHTFRRSCATEMIRAGANLYHVKELLGHETLQTLRHYTRLTITDLLSTHRKCHPREKDEKR